MGPQSSGPRERAKKIIAGEKISAQEAEDLVKQLKRERAFGYARKVLALVRKEPLADSKLRTRLAQAHALCTYKDPDLLPDGKLDQALSILTGDCSLDTSTDQETLGLAGAIYKEKWRLDAQKEHLEQSLAYYLHGYNQGPTGDYGYTGINAAFVLDLLSQTRGTDEALHQMAAARSEQARVIRRDLLEKLPQLLNDSKNEWLGTTWWFLVTIAEAYFGLQQYADARPWLQKAAELSDIPDWELEATARQLAWLAQLQEPQQKINHPPDSLTAWSVLAKFLGHNVAGARSAFLGKVGLALSGGGFRASLFHIGVLAKLAEWDVLRDVEALSCVSGGSIIGAHYYLEVQKLLQTKPDGDITREDYIKIVTRLEREFLAGVKRNLRTRVAASLLTNLKMLFLPNYSRTLRLGDLYEKEIYAKVQDKKGNKPRWLNDLRIQPIGEPGVFSPKDHNWRRQAKVPILVLNATSLNTGHNWQFTATFMGEPPSSVDSEIDGNYRLRRMYYEDAPTAFKKIRLGHAVAASSCVPGLFEPLALAGLYPGKTVRLVDGGVHDNQGVSSLLEQGCSVILASDASGQMEAQDQPSTSLLGVPLRSNSILQARVRISQFHEMCSRKRASLLKGFMFVHLKKDLDVRPIDWEPCPDPSETFRVTPLTPYGLNKSVQNQLASIRTDLDSFSETEAYALMVSGYRMTEQYFGGSVKGWHPPSQRWPWKFLIMEKELEAVEPSPSLAAQLEVAKYIPFKVWRISRPLQYVAAFVSLVILAGLATYHNVWWSITLLNITCGGIVVVALTVLVGRILSPTAMRLIRYQKTVQDALLGFGMATVGWLVAGLHLHVFDRWFLWQGKIKHQLGDRPEGPMAAFTGSMADAPDHKPVGYPESKD